MPGPHATPACPHSELAIGWALHALEPAEQSLVGGHLADCPECIRTVAETEQVGAALGLALSQVAIPSPRLQWRVLAATADAQVRPAGPPPLPLPSSGPDITSKTEGPPETDGCRESEGYSEIEGRPEAAAEPEFPPGQTRRRRLCVPDMLLLIVVALLAFAMATMIVYYAVP
jgi:hypothetical protein